MAAITNRFIDFLSHYGPIPSGDNMYDELIQAEIKKYEIDPPITIEPARLNTLVENFGSNDPKSVILTGTAGDGKTYHCRRVWEMFGGDSDDWNASKKVAHLELATSKKTLTIVKDLSELKAEDKSNVIPAFARAICDRDASAVFLIAANDGQLIASLRDWAETAGGDACRVFRTIEGLLVDDGMEAKDLKLQLFNLSRIDVSAQFDQLVEQIVEHAGWNNCSGCEFAQEAAEHPCPIRINRQRLRGENGNKKFRQRIGELLRLASANRMHLPIRDLLLLCVNIILGDQERNQTLLNCGRARKRARRGQYHLTNPYANVFGANLRDKERQKYQAFSVVGSFGIGSETDNNFDNLLIYGPYSDPARYADIIDSDRFYGGAAYSKLLEDYLEGDREQQSDFLAALERQRQRLFFSLSGDDEYDPWRLSAYRSAGKLLEFSDGYRRGKIPNDLLECLVVGLNRSLCGMMLDDGKKAYFASSGGGGRGRIASILEEELLVGDDRRNPFVTFDFPDESPAPRLLIKDPVNDQQFIAELSLQLTHFEYLMRIARGSLPSSFSRQCYEDFLDFKLVVIEQLRRVLGRSDGAGEVRLQALSVGESGRGEVEEIRIGVAGQ